METMTWCINSTEYNFVSYSKLNVGDKPGSCFAKKKSKYYFIFESHIKAWILFIRKSLSIRYTMTTNRKFAMKQFVLVFGSSYMYDKMCFQTLSV